MRRVRITLDAILGAVERLPKRPVPDLVWEIVIAVFATQIAFTVARILNSGGRSMYVDPWVLLLIAAFAILGFAGFFFAFAYVVTYAAARAWRRYRPEPRPETATVIHLPGRKVG